MAQAEMNAVVRRLGIISKSFKTPLPPALSEGIRGGSSWKVTLGRPGRKHLSTPYHMGSALRGEPETADVLWSLMTDDSSAGMTFEEFCGEFDYPHFKKPTNRWGEEERNSCIDEDTGRYKRTCPCRAAWSAIEKMHPKLRAFLGADYEAVQEACQDY